jgi:hypothetical protein
MLHFAAATKKVKRAYFVLSGGEAHGVCFILTPVKSLICLCTEAFCLAFSSRAH